VTGDRLDDVHRAAEQAALRAAELHERSRRLAAHDGSSSSDVDQARRSLTEAKRRAVRAHRRSAQRHLAAAQCHEHTADFLDAVGKHDRAQEHRQAAVADRAEAASARRAAEKDEQ
jgi:hypothetical protein